MVGAPAIVVLALFIVVALAFACSGQIYVHRTFKNRDFAHHNEVGGVIVAIAGTLYAVLLGFLTVVAWGHFSDARQLTALESAASTDAWHVALALPDARRFRVRHDVLLYANEMVNQEWPAMRYGGFDPNGDLLVMDAMGAAEGFKPADLAQSNAQAATMQQLSALHDVRLRRLEDNASGVGWFEWLVLLIGAGCIIAFCWLFGLVHENVHLLMTSAVAVIIASALALLFELQYPFRTGIGIPPDAWRAVISHIAAMQSGSQSYMQM